MGIVTRPRKFKPGRKVKTLADAARLIERGEWLYFNHKPQHPGWVKSMPMLTVWTFAICGMLRRAIRVQP